MLRTFFPRKAVGTTLVVVNDDAHTSARDFDLTVVDGFVRAAAVFAVIYGAHAD